MFGFFGFCNINKTKFTVYTTFKVVAVAADFIF